MVAVAAMVQTQGTAAGVAALMKGYSLEITSRGSKAIEAARTMLPRGNEVYIASIPGDPYHTVVATAIALAKAGLVPVPHVVARNIQGFTQLNDFLARLKGEAGVTRALVVGGDAEHPVGPYASTLALLQTGAFQRQGITKLGIACYAEPNRRVDTAVLDKALLDKVAFLRREGFEAWLLSQFCFDAELILHRAKRLRADGVTLPLRVGLAGPADVRTLWKFALHCGLGNSMRALGTHVDEVKNLLVKNAPDALLRDIAAGIATEPNLGIVGVHFFAFGGVANLVKWANGVSA